MREAGNAPVVTFGSVTLGSWMFIVYLLRRREGARLAHNPWGDASFGAYFFLLTGFHGTHVLTGVIILLTTAARLAKGVTKPEGVEMAGLYWHFVDLVWVFIFTLFYLV